MAIKRDSLRAERDFYSPMTGNTGTEIRYAAAPSQIQSKYGSQVKDRLSEIGQNTRRSAPIIKAIKTAMKKTDDPFTQVGQQKSYAPQEENDIGAQIEGVAGAAQDAVSEGVAQAETAVREAVKTRSQRASKRRAEQAERRARQRSADKASLDKRFADIGSRISKDKADTDKKIGEQQKQVSSIDKRLGTTYGGVVGLRESLAAIKAKQDAKPRQSVASLPSNYKATEAEAFRAAEAFKEAKGIAARNPNVKVGVDSKGRPVATAVQRTRAEAGPLARTAQGNAARVKQNAQARAQTAAVNRKLQGKTVSQVKSENKQSMQDAARKRNEAFKKAKAQKKSGGRGFGGSATQGKSAPSKPKAGSFGISAAGKKKAAANRAAAKKKASAAKKKSASKSKSTGRGGARGGSKGGSGGRGGSSKGGSAGGSKGGTGRGGRRGGSSGGKGSSSKGGTSRGGARTNRRRSRRRGRRRCDIRCKVNITLLMNMNLLRDDLADVAYFVRELREAEL